MRFTYIWEPPRLPLSDVMSQTDYVAQAHKRSITLTRMFRLSDASSSSYPNVGQCESI